MVVDAATVVVVDGVVVLAAVVVVSTVPVGTQAKHRVVLNRHRGPDSWSISSFPSAPTPTWTCKERVLDAKG